MSLSHIQHRHGQVSAQEGGPGKKHSCEQSQQTCTERGNGLFLFSWQQNKQAEDSISKYQPRPVIERFHGNCRVGEQGKPGNSPEEIPGDNREKEAKNCARFRCQEARKGDNKSPRESQGYRPQGEQVGNRGDQRNSTKIISHQRSGKQNRSKAYRHNGKAAPHSPARSPAQHDFHADNYIIGACGLCRLFPKVAQMKPFGPFFIEGPGNQINTRNCGKGELESDVGRRIRVQNQQQHQCGGKGGRRVALPPKERCEQHRAA
ncbi:hypothetical protein SDC9_90103 [bioreactor metagenome]|uniref:Uncharacterized protein n=1 Tax=bioreactor metagenome TaxID=1076179 RepID=A0A644ZR18_9ZZZZ